MGKGSKATNFCLLFLMLLCLEGLFSWGQAEVKAGEHDYGDALTKALLFLEAQRSGQLPKDNRIKWRNNSALDDGQPEKVDLTGGYYDAGDNVKFNFPMAWTTTMLGWATIGHDMEMIDKELVNARKAVRWGTDYLLKCATATKGRLYAGVGNAETDHNCWQRPEDMAGNRTVYYVNASNPGSDLAAETAAALAVGSIVFRHVDPKYSKLLIEAARRMYDFAVENKGEYSDAVPDVCPYYCSYSGYEDELLWGAVWLFKATHEDKYLRRIKKIGYEDQPAIFSWDNKLAGCYILLARYAVIANDKRFEEYKQPAENFLCKIYPNISTTATNFTPGGLIYKLPVTNMQYVTSISFLFVSYTNYMILGNVTHINCGDGITLTRSQLRKFAKKQVDYILGNNPMNMSYMVGYGTRFPKMVHHRGSSLPSIQNHSEPIACKDGFEYLNARGDNPNILYGAIVGGPSPNDSYAEDRSDYVHSEPTIYVNAAIIGSLASFKNYP